MADVAMLKITLKRSPIGQNERQRATLRGLGLTRLGKTVIRHDTPTVRGMIQAVLHLIQVQS